MAHTSQELATFCKKKGFIYASSEIYGGVAGLYDYGHLGTKLKRNFENQWRKYFLNFGDNFHEIETANIMHENVFKASGHLANFADPIVKCSKCDFSDRADHFLEEKLKQRFEDLSVEELNVKFNEHGFVCLVCESSLLPVSSMNMMFPLQLGVSGQQTGYLRPETAQSPYVNFKLQYELLRKKLPLGLALIGRAYRNEISPRNLTLRMREFTQAELQVFFNPSKINEHEGFSLIEDYPLRIMLTEDREANMVVERTAKMLLDKLPKFYVYHLAKIQQFYLDILKIPKEKFRLYQLNDKEKAFYNKYHFDIEVKLTEHGFTELGGLHYRTDHDLKGHQEISKQKMEVLEEESGEKFIPHVLELSFGVDRNVYALIDTNYDKGNERGNDVLLFPKKLTPFYCVILPLVKNKPEIVNKAREIYNSLKGSYSCYYDQASSVGRRYARADEQGIKYAITIDFDSLEDNCVTIRERNSTKQERINIKELKDKLFELYLE